MSDSEQTQGLSSGDEMGGLPDRGYCEFPECPERAIETWYCMNPSPPPMLLCASLCITHHGTAPEGQDEFARWVMGLRNLQREDYEQHVD